MKKIFTLILIFLLFPVVRGVAGGTYHLKVGESQRVSFTPHVGILTHTIRWVSYSASIDVSEYIGTTATIKVLAPINVSCVIVRCEYEYIQYVGNFSYFIPAVEDFTIYVDSSDPTNITLPSSLTLNVGEFVTLTPTLYPSGAETQLSWSSSNSSVASVSSSGKVFGGDVGSANITVRTSNGLSATCRVTVKKPELSLRVNPSAGLLEKGSSVTLTAGSKNADIYYTLDGSVPTRNSLVYSSPILIDRNVTLKAIAYCDGYTQSNVVTADYTVTALKTVSCYPENNAENVGRNAIPSITFNSEIRESNKWDDIKLKSGSTVIPGEKIISGNTLYFVPDEPLEYNKSYTFTLPTDAIRTGLNEPNFSYSSAFTMFSLYDVSDVVLDLGNGYSSMLLPDKKLLEIWGNMYPKYVEDVLSFSAGAYYMMIIKTDGSLWAWGDNQAGQLGDGTIIERDSFVKVMDNVASVSAGWTYTTAIKEDKSLWAWGNNQYGQFGDEKNSPTKIMDKVAFVSTGAQYAMAIKTDGSLWSWGYNYSGELGDGTTVERLSPAKIMDDVVSVSAGWHHAMAIKTDGSLWAWGDNSYGQLGDGTTTERVSPVKIMDDVLSVSVGVGGMHTVAIKKDGSLWSWGDNSCGQLGDGTTTKRHTPVKIMDNVIFASAGETHTMAMKADGSLWAWGDNSYGQLELGDQTTTGTTIPIRIISNFSPIQSIDFDKEKVELRIGSKSVLQTYLQPFNAEYENISWSSTNESVATVSPKGVITAVAPGMTTITATVETAKGADCSVSCTVTVLDVSGIDVVPHEPLSAWIDNGILHIKGLRQGRSFSIYDMMGKLVYCGNAESTEINRPIEGKGIFIVKTENGTVKVANIN